jgi:hypothetical protein
MDTSRVSINFGQVFTLTVPNSKEKEFKVENYHDQPFDTLRCFIKNTTSYPDPEIIISDATNGVIKLIFHPTTVAGIPLEMEVKRGIDQRIVEQVSRPILNAESVKDAANATTTFFGDVWKRLKTTVIIFIGLSVLFYAIKGTKTGEFLLEVWQKVNAAKIVSMVDELDPRILTNRHELYSSIEWTQFTTYYKKQFGADTDPQNIYNYVGNDFFVTKDLVTDKAGKLLLVDREEAEDICEQIGGRLLNIEELKAYLAGQFIGVENITWPIKLRPYTPEWTDTKVSFYDNYYLYIKDAPKPPESNKQPTSDRFIEVDEDEVDAAFRCGFPTAYYLPVK